MCLKGDKSLNIFISKLTPTESNLNRVTATIEKEEKSINCDKNKSDPAIGLSEKRKVKQKTVNFKL